MKSTIGYLAAGMLMAAAGPPKGGGGKAGAKTPAKKEDLKAPEENALSIPDDMADELLADAGAGATDMNAGDLAIPRLGILQGLSPAVQKRTDTYVEGAEPGHIMDSVSQRIFNGEAGITAIPCAYRKTHIEWKPDRGGFVADHGPDDSILQGCSKDDKGHYINKAGNIITPTAEYYLLVYDADADTTLPYVLSMAGAQLKHSRKWNTSINMLRVANPKGGAPICPPIFYRTYELKTAPESNDQGTWFAWDIKGGQTVFELPNGHDIYRSAKALREGVTSGSVKVAPPQEAGGGSASEDDAAPM